MGDEIVLVNAIVYSQVAQFTLLAGSTYMFLATHLN